MLYFISATCFYLNASAKLVAVAYIGIKATDYLLVLTGGGLLSRLIKNGLSKDVFNSENETFPQEERLLENEYSINLPARYRLKSKVRDSWINITNPFRGILVAGTPGAGKTYLFLETVVRYGKLNFYAENGKREKSEQFQKETGLEMSNVFAKKMEQGKTKMSPKAREWASKVGRPFSVLCYAENSGRPLRAIPENI